MKELLTYIIQSLVDHPDEVSVTERVADGETVFEVRVADGDMGKVIGRQGRIVRRSVYSCGPSPRDRAKGVRGYYGLIPKKELLKSGSFFNTFWPFIMRKLWYNNQNSYYTAHHRAPRDGAFEFK